MFRSYKTFLTLIVPLFFLTGCTNYQWGWYVINPNTPQGALNLRFLVSGFYDTISLSLISMFFAMIIGLVIALFALTSSKTLLITNRVYVEVIRSIPVLVLLLWVYYGLPTLLNISLGHFWAGVITLSIAESAFLAEVFRSGIQSIPKGQHDAAKSLGLNYWQKMRFIVLPLAIRQILPPLGNQFIYILKMSSLVSVVGLSDLTRKANELIVSEYLPLEIYSFLVLEYLVLILIVSHGVRVLERKLKIPDQ